MGSTSLRGGTPRPTLPSGAAAASCAPIELRGAGRTVPAPTRGRATSAGEVSAGRTRGTSTCARPVAREAERHGRCEGSLPTGDQRPVDGRAKMILETTLLTRGRGVAVAFLFSALAGAVALAPPARADDVSDTSVGAMPIPIGVTVGAAIQTVGDVDWFVVQDPLLGDGALYVDTDGLRPRVRVFDALLRQVAANQIAPGFTGPVEQRIPLYPGIAEPIRIEVRRQSGPLGAYRLRVERVVLAPPVL